LLSIVAIAGIFYSYASYSVNKRLNKEYDVTPEALVIPTDSASIAIGKHLVDIKGCRDCHGDNMAGKIIADNMLLGTVAGPNLTRGNGGLPLSYKIENWVKAIRHGLDSNNYPIMVMPSLETSKMSKEDMQSMVAYLENLAPVDNIMPKSSLGIMIKTMAHLDAIDVIPAEKIDHSAPMTANVNAASPGELGKYLSVMCSGCHRENFKGGPPMAPGFPPAPDITSTGATGHWSEEQFVTALRTAQRPDGTVLDPNMPVQMTKHYTDSELHALYSFLKTL
jgi:mono/diheme cytochrome c family protein